MAQTADAATTRHIRRLRVTLALVWSLGWAVGILSFALFAIRLGGSLSRERLDSRLAYGAMAAYGLTWFDANGGFHDEVFWREPELVDPDLDIWVLVPDSAGTVLLAPRRPRFDVRDLAGVAQSVALANAERTVSGQDARGAEYRLHARPTYAEDSVTEPLATIIVVGDPTPGLTGHSEQTRSILLAAALLLVLGIGFGAFLAEANLRPLAKSLQQRERFVAAAAHELRTPLATLRAVCESARAGDEPARQALERATRLVGRTSRVVDDLLLYARLDSEGRLAERRSVRLDLLVEALLPEDSPVQTDLHESVVAVDPALVEVAVRNLVENAQRHGGGADAVLVRVHAGCVQVQDRGPGFPRDVLEIGPRGFAIAPSQGGVGLGLAIAALVARLHGTHLQLENLPAGGARATLAFAPLRD